MTEYVKTLQNFLTDIDTILFEINRDNVDKAYIKDWQKRVIFYLHIQGITTRLGKLRFIGTVDIPIMYLKPNEPHKKDEAIFEDFAIAKRILNDLLIKETLINNKSQENLKTLKLLKAREENFDFELTLAEMVCGDNGNFPYRSSHYLTTFFADLNFNFIHNGETRRTWVKEKLEELTIVEIHNLISKGLFKRKYFNDFAKEKNLNRDELFQEAVLDFKEFIQESLEANIGLDLSTVLDMNVNLELLFDQKANTSDKDLNELIEEAKDRFLNNDRQVALEKIWDSFERIKTYYDSNPKKKNVSADKLSQNISVDFDKEFIDEEFKKLTKVGNNYKIRHHETSKLSLSPEHIHYLFFRMLSLIDLCLIFLHKEDDDLGELL